VNSRVESDASGFTIHPAEGPPIRVPWDSVRRIRTYKIDLFSYDEVCLGFELPDPNAAGASLWIEVTESNQGYRPLVQQMEAQFPTIAANWESEVMFPAFESCEAILFSRE
jgi:hypothetical protein